MKCLILAAGYATRLYPLTENYPKPLLDVSGKSIIDWLIDDLEQTGQIDGYVIVSNHKFIKHFEQWKENHPHREKLTLLDDGSTENANRLGAVRDIAFAVSSVPVEEDLLVLAGDNLLDFSLQGFLDYFREKQATCVMRHFEPDKAKLRRTGVASVAEDGHILEMEEKPEEPKSSWAVPPFYLYRKEDLPKLLQGVKDEVCNLDAPGSFICWMCGVTEVYAYEMPGRRYDIGGLASYEAVKSGFPPASFGTPRPPL